MAKIVAEEFDTALKFVDEIVKFLLPLEKRKYVETSHVVGCNEFFIFVSYHKENFGSEIRNFLSKICNEAIKKDLYRYGLKVHRPQIEEAKNLDYYRFADRFNINFTAE